MDSFNNNFGNFHDFDVQLYRDSLSRPWGFRIQGGADFNFPLTVQRVFSGSPSEVKLLRGDVILGLDGYDVGRLTHKQAQDVIRVAGAGLTVRVRRPGSKVLSTATGSPQVRRPHSTTPRQESSSTYHSTSQPSKSTWQPPASPQNSSSAFGNFGVQYGPSKTSSMHHRPVNNTSHQPTRLSSQSPYEEEDYSLKRVEDSLKKLTMNHLSNEDEEVDYSFTKKSVSERRKLFQGNDNKSQTDFIIAIKELNILFGLFDAQLIIAMGRTRDISDFTRGQVPALIDEGYSQRCVARRSNISLCAVQNCLRRKRRENCGEKKKTSARVSAFLQLFILPTLDYSCRVKYIFTIHITSKQSQT